MRFAKELLVKLSASCCESSSEDFATVAEILKLRIKGLNAQLYFDCVSQVLKNNPEYPVLALRHFIHTDLLHAPPKSQPNMKMLGTIFKVIPENPEGK
jgi:hypothetical protein